ncbi:hypothetical protein EYF80_017133 [Liparis tanakae]|uniref:Uncharacterized protein n=1 Tax=Liparis tanakae TaxID=230148 RepID=A0A4Z2I5V1_9TELE|nr:hypothetical protein EYF80_017133 [Liparis tanakae]
MKPNCRAIQLPGSSGDLRPLRVHGAGALAEHQSELRAIVLRLVHMSGGKETALDSAIDAFYKSADGDTCSTGHNEVTVFDVWSNLIQHKGDDVRLHGQEENITLAHCLFVAGSTCSAGAVLRTSSVTVLPVKAEDGPDQCGAEVEDHSEEGVDNHTPIKGEPQGRGPSGNGQYDHDDREREAQAVHHHAVLGGHVEGVLAVIGQGSENNAGHKSLDHLE